MDHGRQEYYHMMWEGQDKGQGLAWYGIRGPRGGGEPSSPRSRASSPCDPPPTGRSSGRVRPENLSTTPFVRPQREAGTWWSVSMV